MGMCMALCAISDTNIERVLADPPLIWQVVAPADPDAYAQARAATASPGVGHLLSKWFGRQEAQSKPPARDLELADGEGASTDLDKAWHGVHYLLTQTSWEGEGPLSMLLTGGEEVPDIEVGIGQARVLTAAQTQAFGDALAAIDEAFLRSRFNPTEMMRLDIYPNIWDRDPGDDDSFGYCAHHFATLKSFVAQTVRDRLGMVIYIT